MKITKYIHSCLVIEKGPDRIMFDPGLFSFNEGRVKPGQFQNIQAVILTHYHPDHINETALAEILKNNPGAVVLANSHIVSKLGEKDIKAEVFEKDRYVISSFVLKAFDAPHERILADTIPPNTAFTVDDRVLHPGDSLSENLYALKGTPILCLPVMAPWETDLKCFEFAKRLAPRYVVPVHDGYAKDFFIQSRYQNFQKYLKNEGIEFQWMDKPGDYFEV